MAEILSWTFTIWMYSLLGIIPLSIFLAGVVCGDDKEFRDDKKLSGRHLAEMLIYATATLIVLAVWPVALLFSVGFWVGRG